MNVGRRGGMAAGNVAPGADAAGGFRITGDSLDPTALRLTTVPEIVLNAIVAKEPITMSRPRFLARAVLAFGLVFPLPPAGGNEPAATKVAAAPVAEKPVAALPDGTGPAADRPAGGRVGYLYLVNGAVTDAVVKAAGITGHEGRGGPFVGTWHDIKGVDAIQPGRLDPLERGEFDMLLAGTLHCYPNAETWKNHLGLDSTPAAFATLGSKNNPRFRLVWQTYIWPVGKAPKDGPKTLDVAATKTRASREPLAELQKLCDAINENLGRRVMVISPAGQATVKLVEMVADGKFPGITDPADLWTEFNMHSNRHVLALTAFCNVGAMYGVSPLGLKPDFTGVGYGGGGKGPKPASMEGITDEQMAILQQIAFDALSTCPQSGFPQAAPAAAGQ